MYITFNHLHLLMFQEEDQDMEVDIETSATLPSKHSLPEIEIYCYLLVLIFLIDQKRYDEVCPDDYVSRKACVMIDALMHVNSFNFCYNQAKACSSASIARIKNLNRRTIDVLASRLYFYYSLSYELTGDLAEIRGYAFFFQLI